MITTNLNNKNINIRTLPHKNANLRAVKNSDGTTTLTGRAIVFNEPSQPLPFTEYIEPGALQDVDFSKTLLLYAHDFNNILARADSETLHVNVDRDGLTFTATLPDTTLANDVRENINAGNLKGCSFGFTIADGGDSWSTADDGSTIHTVSKIATVDELTITPIPAYTQTSVQVQRDLAHYKEEKKNMEEHNSSAASAAVSLDEITSAISAAVAPISETVASLVNGSDNRAAACSTAEKREDDDGLDDVSDVADDSDADIDDDANGNSSSPASTAASSAAGSVSSTATSSANSSADSSASTSSTRSLPKEENKKMINITPNNPDAKVKEQLRDFAHYLLTREVRPSLKRDDAGVTGIGLTQGSVLIPETILSANHETHQFPRLEQYVHSVSVSTTTGKQPYFEENTGVLQTKEEFAHAKDIELSALKFINWDLKTYAGKLALSRELLMDSEKGSSENWLTEAQNQMRDLQDNTNDSLIAAALQNGTTAKTASDAVADMKTILNVNLKPQDSSQAQIVLTQSAYNALDQLKDGFGRPLLQPDPTSATSNLLFGKPVIKVDDTLFGKAGDAIAVIAPLNKVIYDFQMGQVSGQFIDNFDIFDTTLGVFLRKDVENGRPDLVNILKLTPKSIAASDPSHA